MPIPGKNESKKDFMDRCMGYPDMQGYEGDQRYAICQAKWDEAKGKSESKSEPMEIEKRTFNIELRARDDGAKTMKGHAAIFNEEAVIGGKFREMVAPGAFTKALERGDDVRALFNHDPNYVLGRTKSGTLRMIEDEKGLAIEIDPPETQFARDLSILMERGDISQMSFAFAITEQEWREAEDEGLDLRIIRDVRLYDISAVTYPAYAGTEIALRSMQEWKDAEAEKSAAEAKRQEFIDIERKKLEEKE